MDTSYLHRILSIVRDCVLSPCALPPITTMSSAVGKKRTIDAFFGGASHSSKTEMKKEEQAHNDTKRLRPNEESGNIVVSTVS